MLRTVIGAFLIAWAIAIGPITWHSAQTTEYPPYALAVAGVVAIAMAFFGYRLLKRPATEPPAHNYYIINRALPPQNRTGGNPLKSRFMNTKRRVRK